MTTSLRIQVLVAFAALVLSGAAHGQSPSSSAEKAKAADSKAAPAKAPEKPSPPAKPKKPAEPAKGSAKKSAPKKPDAKAKKADPKSAPKQEPKVYTTGPRVLRDKDGNVIPTSPDAYNVDSALPPKPRK